MTIREPVDLSIERLSGEDGAALTHRVEVRVHSVVADVKLDVKRAAPSIYIGPCTGAVEEGL